MIITRFSVVTGWQSMTNEELAILVQQGNNDLMGELWEQNTGIFYMKAYGLYTRYADRCKMAGVELDGIIQCCYFALCDAVVAFKADGEYKPDVLHQIPAVESFEGCPWHTNIQT